MKLSFLKPFLFVFYILFKFSLSYLCLDDEFYNTTSKNCVQCKTLIPGCFNCELNNDKIICKNCLNGYKANLNNNQINSCNINCGYPYTYSNIPEKELQNDCQINLWKNEHISNNFYENDLLFNLPRETSNQELESLKLFYKQTNGPFWLNNFNWLEGDPCLNNWFGIKCNLRGNVISIIFNENYLNGVLSKETLAGLIHLKTIIITNTLNNNEDSANIINYVSPYIWKISSLNQVIIKNVELKENFGILFPENDKNLESNVEIIELDYNSLSGSLPNFERFIKLKTLSLSNNSLNGNLANLNTIKSKLEYLQLNNNNFEGNIPNLDNIDSSLRVLDLRSNINLKGNLPSKYFSEKYFKNLSYIGLILTHVTPPDNCKNHAFCIKRLIVNARSINDPDFVLDDYEKAFLLPRNLTQ